MASRSWAICLTACLVIASAACGGSDGGTTSDTRSDVPLDSDAAAPDAADAADVAPDTDSEVGPDTVTPPSTVWARRVEDPSDLIGGPGAYARVGSSWVIGNERARFIIQDKGAAVGLQLFGGNLIDADLARPDGEPGRDSYREMFALVDFRVLRPTSVAVLDDGASGEQAVLRVSGTLEKSGILGFLDDFADDTAFNVDLDYVLRPDTTLLILRTHIRTVDGSAAQVSVGDFLGFGKQLQLFTPEGGFGSPENAGNPSMVASRGQDTSYAYGRVEGALTVPFTDGSGTGAFLDFGLDVPAGGEAVSERFFIVGDGSPSSVIDVALEAMARPTGLLTGTVTDSTGAPLAGVFVTALRVPDAGGPPGHAGNQARTDAAGAFRMRVEPGAWQLIASGEGRLRSAPVSANVTAGSQQELALTIGAHARVDVRYTVDGPVPSRGETAPVKVSLQALGDTQVPDPRLGERVIAGQAHITFAGPDVDSFVVPPGHYRVVVSHGAEYQREVIPDWEATDGAVLAGHLARVIDTADFIGCDFHQHTIGSLDANATLEDKLRENLGAGLECAATTDHDNVVDMRPVVAALGSEPAFHSVVGNEISVNGVGHFNAYPLPTDPAAPDALIGAQLWAGRTIQQLFAALRALPGELTIQINHPRSDPLKGYFVSLRVDPWTGLATKGVVAQDFDAIEVNAELGNAASYDGAGWAVWRADSSDGVPVLADWFAMLNRGDHVTAVGNSDSHDVGDDAGWPRTYLRLGTDDPSQVTDAMVTEAIRAQHAIISRGAFLHVLANGVRRMGHTELVDASGGPVSISVQAEAPPWLALSTVELYVNGLLVESRDATAPPEGGTLWFDDTFTVPAPEDAWVVVVARGPAMGAPVFDGFTFAVTNPIYLDADGGGFTPPGPVELPPTLP
ncbi:MAG: CehA/McbA family metallohydrolase [Deltaproteobacteria bacterium]|nr:CehA/McbA family metallohydrolase [Deltaproteobacteria bacterium]MCB9788949.1 CehA/McbA family metallohydrolase [Deltaproteobacteria bacterium]